MSGWMSTRFQEACLGRKGAYAAIRWVEQVKTNEDATWRITMVVLPTLSNGHNIPNAVFSNFSKHVGAYSEPYAVCRRNKALHTLHFNHARLLTLMGISYIRSTMSSRPLLMEPRLDSLDGSYIVGTEGEGCYLSPGSIRRHAIPPFLGWNCHIGHYH